MLEVIQSIEEVSHGEKEGFKIITNKQEILLLIDSMQCCCEDFGYFLTEDSIDKYIGAEIRDITITDTLLKTIDFKPLGDCNYIVDNATPETGLNMYNGDTMFVNINTNIGTLQFCAYNEHNGYYGHEAQVISKQLKHSEWL